MPKIVFPDSKNAKNYQNSDLGLYHSTAPVQKININRELYGNLDTTNYNPNAVNINDISESYQSGWDKLANGVLQGTETFASAVITGAAAVLSLPVTPILTATNDNSFMDNWLRNDLMGTLNDLDEQFKNDVAPIRLTEEQQENPFAAASLWGGFANGIGFLASAFVGTGLMSKAITKPLQMMELAKIAELANPALKGASKAEKLKWLTIAQKGEKLDDVIAKLKNIENLTIDGQKVGVATEEVQKAIEGYIKYQDKMSRYGDMIGTVYSRVGESQMEAYDSYTSIIEANKHRVKNGEITEKELNDIAGSASNNVFFANMALSVLEFQQYRNLFKSAAKLPEVVLENGVARGIKMTKLARYAKNAYKIGLQSTMEGGEELLQYGMQQAARNLADNDIIGKESNNFIGESIKEAINGLSTGEGQVSALLGAVLGGGMTGIQNFRSKENTRTIENSKQAAELYNRYTQNGEVIPDDALVQVNGKYRLSKEILSKVNNYQILNKLKEKAIEDGDKVGAEQYDKLMHAFVVTNKLIDGTYDEHIKSLKALQKKSKDEIKQELGLDSLPTRTDLETGEEIEISPIELLENKIQEAKQFEKIFNNYHTSDNLANLSFDTKQKMVYDSYAYHINNNVLKNLNSQINEIQEASSDFRLNNLQSGIATDPNNPIESISPIFRNRYKDLAEEKRILEEENKDLVKNFMEFEKSPEKIDFLNLKQKKEQFEKPTAKQAENKAKDDFIAQNSNKVMQLDTEEEKPDHNLLKSSDGKLYRLSNGVYVEIDNEGNPIENSSISIEEAKKRYNAGNLKSLGTRKTKTSKFYKILFDGRVIDRDGNEIELTPEMMQNLKESTVSENDLLFNEEAFTESLNYEASEINKKIIEAKIKELQEELEKTPSSLESIDKLKEGISALIENTKSKIQKLSEKLKQYKVGKETRRKLNDAIEQLESYQEELNKLEEEKLQLINTANKLQNRIDYYTILINESETNGTLITVETIKDRITEITTVKQRLEKFIESLSEKLSGIKALITKLLDSLKGYDNLLSFKEDNKSIIKDSKELEKQLQTEQIYSQLIDENTESLLELLKLPLVDYNINSFLEINSEKALQKALLNFKNVGGVFTEEDKEAIKEHLEKLGIPEDIRNTTYNYTPYDDFDNSGIENIDEVDNSIAEFYGAKKDISQLSTSTTSRQYEDKEDTVKTKGKWNHILNKFLEQLDMAADALKGIKYQLRVVTYEKNPEYFSKEEVANIKAMYPNIPNLPIFKGVVVKLIKVNGKLSPRNVKFNGEIIKDTDDKTEAVSTYFHSPDFSYLTNKNNLSPEAEKKLRDEHELYLKSIYEQANSGKNVFININSVSNGVINTVSKDAELLIQEQLFPEEKNNQTAIDKVKLFVKTLRTNTKKFGTVFAEYKGKNIPLRAKHVSRESALTAYQALVKFLENNNKNVIVDEKSGMNVFDIIKQHIYWSKKNGVYFEKGVLYIKDKEFAFNSVDNLVSSKEDIISAFQYLFAQVDAKGLRENDKAFLKLTINDDGVIVKKEFKNYKSFILDKTNPKVSTNIVMNKEEDMDNNLFKSLYLNIQSLSELAENKITPVAPVVPNNKPNNPPAANNDNTKTTTKLTDLPKAAEVFGTIINKHNALEAIKHIVRLYAGQTDKIAKILITDELVKQESLKGTKLLANLIDAYTEIVASTSSVSGINDGYTIDEVLPYVKYVQNLVDNEAKSANNSTTSTTTSNQTTTEEVDKNTRVKEIHKKLDTIREKLKNSDNTLTDDKLDSLSLAQISDEEKQILRDAYKNNQSITTPEIKTNYNGEEPEYNEDIIGNFERNDTGDDKTPNNTTTSNEEKLSESDNSEDIEAPEKLYTNRTTDNIENFNRFKEWFYKRFPKSINVEVAYNLIKNRAMGTFRDTCITLWESASEGTGFHEAFHAAFRLFYTEKQRQQLYNEFRNKEGYGKTFKGVTKKYSEFSEIEVEENLADEFEQLIVNDTSEDKVYEPKTYIGKMLWKMFQDIKNFFQHVFFNKTYKDILFEKIKTGYFKNSEILSFINPERDKLYNHQTNKYLDKESTNKILNSMSVIFFRELSTKYGADKLLDENLDIDGFEDIYETILEAHSHITFLQNKENYDYAVKEHKKLLANIGINVKTIEDEDDDVILENTNEKEQNDSAEIGIRSGDFEKSAIAINPKKTMSNKIKMFMTFTALLKEKNGIYVYDRTKEGLYQKVDSGVLYKKLLNSLVGIDSYKEMANKVLQLSNEGHEDVYRFARLVGILNNRSEIRKATTLSELAFQQKLRAAFNKSLQEGLATKSYNDGRTFKINLVDQKFRKKEIADSTYRFLFKNNTKLIHIASGKKATKGIKVLDLPRILEKYKTLPPTKYFDFLAEFGIRLVGTYKENGINKNDNILPENIISAIEQIHNVLINNYNSSKFQFKISQFYSGFQSDVHGNKYTIDFNSRINDLIAYNQSHNVDNSLNYDSVDGKTIYAIALKNFYTLIADKLKKGIAPEHLNAKTNAYIRNSKLFKKFLETGKLDLNIFTNNGYINTLDEGIPNSKLGKASRIKQELDYILSGIYSNFKEADKSNAYLFELGEFATKQQVNDIDSIWENYLKGYLIDEIQSSDEATTFGFLSETVRKDFKNLLDKSDKNNLSIRQEAKIKAEIDTKLNNVIDNQIKYLLNNRILFKKGDNEDRYILLLDDVSIKKLGYNFKNLTLAEVKLILRYAEVNNLIAKQEILKLFIGNPIQYNDFVNLIKRNSLSAANKLFPDVSVEHIETLNSLLKRSDSKPFSNKMNVVVRAENRETTFPENSQVLEYMKNTLKLDEKQIKAFQVGNGGKGTEHTDGSGLILPDLYRQFMLSIGKWSNAQEEGWQKAVKGEETDVVFPVEKLQYLYINEKGETISMKFAVLPYFKHQFPNSSITQEEMEGNDMIIYPSATKIAKWKGVKSLNIEGLGLQVDNVQKSKQEIKIVTQMEKHVYANMFDNGVATNPEAETILEIINTTKNTINNIKDKENLNNLGITKDGVITDSAKLIDYLDRAATRSELSENDKMAINSLRDTAGNIRPVSLLLIKDRIYPMLQAAFGGVVKYKKGGEQLAQVPAADLDNSLSFYLKKDPNTGKRKLTMQVKLPYYLKGNQKAISEITSKVLNIIGARIPVEGLTSIELMEVAGFLPKSMGNTIMLPNGITIKSGTDYDFDKMTVYYPYTDKEGNYLRYYSNPDEETLNKLLNDYLYKETNKIPEYLEIKKELKKELNILGDDENIESFVDKLFNVATDGALDNFVKETKLKIEELKSKLQEFREPLIKQFNSLSIEEKNGEDRLQNRLLETYLNMLKNESTMSKMLSTNSVAELKSISEEFELEQSDKKENKWNGLVDILQNAEQAVANNIGKNQVGVAALHATNNVMCQIAGVTMNINLKFKDLVGKAVSIGRISDLLDNNMAKRIADYLGGFVDVAKDAWVFNLNLSPYVTDTALLLTRSGLSRETVATFTNQPIIRILNKYNTLAEDGLLRVLEEVKDKDGKVIDYELKGEKLKDYIKEIRKILKDNTTQEYINAEKNKIYDNLTPENWKDSKEFKLAKKHKEAEEIQDIFEGLNEKERNILAANQLEVLERFLEYKKHSSKLSDLMQSTNYDTSGVSSNVHDTKRKIAMTEEVLNDPIFTNVDKMFEKTFIGSIYNYIKTVPNKQASFNIMSNKKVAKAFNKILDKYTYLNKNEFLYISKLIENEFMYFITVTSPLAEFENSSLMDNKDNKIFDKTFKSFHNQNAVESLKYLNVRLKDNLPTILKKLVAIENEGDVNNIVSINEFMDKEDSDILADDIESLLNHNDKNVVNAMKTILLNGYMQIGYNNSPTSFTKLLPSIFLNNKIINPAYDLFLSNLNKLSEAQVEELVFNNFLPQFYQNNATNKKLVPVTFDQSASQSSKFVEPGKTDVILGKTFRKEVKIQNQNKDGSFQEVTSNVYETKYFYNTGELDPSGGLIYREMQLKGVRDTSRDILLYAKEYYPDNTNSQFYSGNNVQVKFSLKKAFENPTEIPKFVPENSTMVVETEETPTQVVDKNQITFKTGKGSVYTYLPDGKIQRFKTVENKQYEPQDLIVFVKFKNFGQEQNFLAGVQDRKRSGTKVYVIDKQGNTYSKNADIKDKDVALALVDTKTNKVIDIVETKKEPTIGYSTYDERRYVENGEPMRSMHIGNKVTEISNNNSVDSEIDTSKKIQALIKKYANKVTSNDGEIVTKNIILKSIEVMGIEKVEEWLNKCSAK